jgi:antitoxin component YwqK of YwqJK toxin-antitoxin module
MKGMKQGKWINKYPKLRGEPGYDEEGEYKNDRKEGMWRTYNLMGDLLAQENFKWGNKNGKCYYFTLAGLEHEESWRAVNPDKGFDTIDVQDLKDPNKYEKVIVQTDGTSLKHGVWKYYIPGTGNVVETQEYFMNKLKNPEDELNNLFKDSKLAPTIKKDTIPSSPQKPKEVLEFEKKNPKKTKPKSGKTIPDHH